MIQDRNVNPFGNMIDKKTKVGLFDAPFPDDLITTNGNPARFNKSKNKTHTSFYNRKLQLKIEIQKSNGSSEIIDIGTYLMSKIDIKDSVSIKLDDLSKPMMSTDAENVKSGFQWFRNIPTTQVVKELIKAVYPDPRNGECPREYIISDIKNSSIDGNPQIYSLGKPPVFGRIPDEKMDTLTCEAVCDSGNSTEIILGVGNLLYKFNDITGLYNKIYDFPKDWQITKLWYNPIKNKVIGIATEKEELVSKDLNTKLYRTQVAVDYIIFEYKNNEVTIIKDSQQENPKLFTGRYHIVQPYFTGRWVLEENYWNSVKGGSGMGGERINCIAQLGDSLSTFPKPSSFYLILSALGNYSGSEQFILDPIFGKIYYPKTEGIFLTNSQNIGFIVNHDPNRFYATDLRTGTSNNFVSRFGSNITPEDNSNKT